MQSATMAEQLDRLQARIRSMESEKAQLQQLAAKSASQAALIEQLHAELEDRLRESEQEQRTLDSLKDDMARNLVCNVFVFFCVWFVTVCVCVCVCLFCLFTLPLFFSCFSFFLLFLSLRKNTHLYPPPLMRNHNQALYNQVQEALDAATAENDNLQQRAIQLENDLSTARRDLDNATRNNNEVTSAAAKRVAELQSALDSLSGASATEIASLKAALKDTQSALALEKSKLAKLEAEHKALLDAQWQRDEEHQARSRDFDFNQRRIQGEHERMQRELHERTLAHDSAFEKMSGELRAALADASSFKKQADESGARLGDVLARERALNSELKDKKAENADLANMVALLKSQFDEERQQLLDQLHRIMDEHGRAERAVTSVQGDVAAQRGVIDELQRKIRELEAGSQADAAWMTQVKGDLDAAAAERAAALEQLRAAKKDKEDSLQQLQARLAEKETERARLANEIKLLQEELRSMTAERDSLNAQNGSLRTGVRQAQNTAERLSAELESAKTLVLQLEDHASGSRTRDRDAFIKGQETELKIQMLQAELDRVKAERDILRRNNDAMRTREEDTYARLEAAKSEGRALRDELGRVREANAHEVSDLAAQVKVMRESLAKQNPARDYDLEIAKLQEALNISRSMQQQQQQQQTAASRDLPIGMTASADVLDAAKRELAGALQDLNGERAKARDLQAALTRLERDTAQMRAEHAALQARYEGERSANAANAAASANANANAAAGLSAEMALRNELEQLRTRSTAMEDDARQARFTLEKQRSAEKIKLDELGLELEKARSDARMAVMARDKKAKELENAEGRALALQLELEKTHSTISSLKSQLGDVAAASAMSGSDLQARTFALRDQTARLQEQLEEAQRALNARNRDIQRLEEAMAVANKVRNESGYLAPQPASSQARSFNFDKNNNNNSNTTNSFNNFVTNTSTTEHVVHVKETPELHQQLQEENLLLHSEVNRLHAEITQLVKALSAAPSAAPRDFGKELHAHEADLSHIEPLRATIHELEDDKAALTRENVQLRAEMASLTQFIRDLQGELNDTRCRPLAVFNTVLREVNSEALSDTERLRAAFVHSDTAVRELVGSAALSSAAAETAESSASSPRTDLLLQKQRELELQNKRLLAEVEGKMSSLAESSSVIRQQDAEIALLAEEASHLKDVDQQLRARLDQIVAERSRILSERDTLVTHISTLHNEITRSTNTIVGLRGKLEGIALNAASANYHTNNNNNTTNNTNNTINNNSERCTPEALQRVRDELRTVTQDLQTVLGQRDRALRDLDRLGQRLPAMEDAEERAREDVRRLRAERDAATAALQQMQARLHDLSSSMAAPSAADAALRAEIARLLRRIEGLEAELARLRQSAQTVLPASPAKPVAVPVSMASPPSTSSAPSALAPVSVPVSVSVPAPVPAPTAIVVPVVPVVPVATSGSPSAQPRSAAIPPHMPQQMTSAYPSPAQSPRDSPRLRPKDNSIEVGLGGLVGLAGGWCCCCCWCCCCWCCCCWCCCCWCCCCCCCCCCCERNRGCVSVFCV